MTRLHLKSDASRKDAHRDRSAAIGIEGGEGAKRSRHPHKSLATMRMNAYGRWARDACNHIDEITCIHDVYTNCAHLEHKRP